MKEGNKYRERLLLFADRLGNIESDSEPIIREACIEWPENYVKTWYSVTFNMDCFFELPLIFDEWSYYEAGDEIEVIGYPKHLGMIGMLLNFFKLHPKEFTHLFDIEEYQNIKKYGGRILNKHSQPKDVAFNIREFVKNKYTL